jgi:hypothetical protein
LVEVTHIFICDKSDMTHIADHFVQHDVLFDLISQPFHV